MREIEETSEELSGYEIISVHIEGGNPGLLGTDGLADFLYACRQMIPAEGNCQWVIDMLPSDLSAAMMTTLRNAHIDGINVGVMTTRMKEYPCLKRPCYLAAFDGAMSILTMHRQKGTGIVLLTGIPEQTEESLAESVRYCMKSNPERFSFYPYLAKGDQTSYLAAIDPILREYGFMSYGDGSHYAQPGKEELDLTADARLLSHMGFGVGAFTCFDGISYHNTEDLQRYIQYSGDPIQIAVME